MGRRWTAPHAITSSDPPVPVRNLIGLTLSDPPARGEWAWACAGVWGDWDQDRSARPPAWPRGVMVAWVTRMSERWRDARPRSGGALVTVMEPADLRNGDDPATWRGFGDDDGDAEQ